MITPRDAAAPAATLASALGLGPGLPASHTACSLLPSGGHQLAGACAAPTELVHPAAALARAGPPLLAPTMLAVPLAGVAPGGGTAPGPGLPAAILSLAVPHPQPHGHGSAQPGARLPLGPGTCIATADPMQCSPSRQRCEEGSGAVDPGGGWRTTPQPELILQAPGLGPGSSMALAVAPIETRAGHSKACGVALACNPPHGGGHDMTPCSLAFPAAGVARHAGGPPHGLGVQDRTPASHMLPFPSLHAVWSTAGSSVGCAPVTSTRRGAPAPWLHSPILTPGISSSSKPAAAVPARAPPLQP